jgi:hypothetical protein
MFTMVLLILVTVAAYLYDTVYVPSPSGATPLFSLFSDAFKVGLGAFIGVMSQWAALVFGQEAASRAGSESK